jgi:hypothetical protein
MVTDVRSWLGRQIRDRVIGAEIRPEVREPLREESRLESRGAFGDPAELLHQRVHLFLRGAARRGIEVRRVTAEVWRKRLLLLSEQRSGREAKRSASDAARRVIAWSDAPRPRSLRHDAAEAILVGLWGVLEAGWLRESPL